MELLATLGLVKEIREAQLETFGTVAGCSPAFVESPLEAFRGDGSLRRSHQEHLAGTCRSNDKRNGDLSLRHEKTPGALKMK